MPTVLRGGELLLTHGMTIGAGDARRRRFIADLARAGLGGLMIELGAGMKRVPSALVAEASEHDLPLIVLHRPIPWVDVTEAVHRAIVNRQAWSLQRGQELHDQFAALVAAGAGVPEVLRALADSVQNPVLLTRDGEILYAAARQHPHGALSSAFEAVSRGLPHAPPTLEVPVAVATDGEWGVVTVLGLERPVEQFDRIALERAVPVLALAFVRGHELETLAARDRGEFLGALADPDATVDDRVAYRRAAAIGFEARASWLVPVVADISPGVGRLDAQRWALVAREVRHELQSRGTPAVVGTLEREAHLAMVIGLAHADQRAPALDALAATLRQAIARVRDAVVPVVCAGGPSATWTDVGAGLRESIEALPAMRHAPEAAWHDVSKPELRRLLWALRGQRPLTDFVQRRLAPLREYDEGRRGRSDLLQTLEALCAHGGRKAETARALHLERQSLYKRLARIEELLGEDLDDEDTLLGLHLALRAQDLLATS
jgi:purine catabolism regulator